MFDRWVNDLFNWLIRWNTANTLEGYQAYPASNTAVLLVDTQTALLQEDPPFAERLKVLVEFARSKNFGLIYSPYDPGANHAFPTAGHQMLKSRLSSPVGARFPSAISPVAGDVVLPPRALFSAFSQTNLRKVLEDNGWQRLVVVGPLTLVSLDSTVRDAVQYDFHVTVLEDVTGLADSDTTKKHLKHTFSRTAHSILDFESFRSAVEDTQTNQVS